MTLDRSTQTFARCLRRTITRETASWASACRADGEEVAAGRAEDLGARLTAELDRWLRRRQHDDLNDLLERTAKA